MYCRTFFIYLYLPYWISFSPYKGLKKHRFVTTTTLAKDVLVETISKMLGHTNMEITQIYARITNKK